MIGMEAVQYAMHAGLASIAALDGRRYLGDAPQGAEGPYVVQADPTEIPAGGFSEDVTENTATVHVWSKTTGSTMEVFDILGLIDAAVKDPQTFEGRRVVSLQREFTTVLFDGEWIHVPARYRALTSEAV